MKKTSAEVLAIMSGFAFVLVLSLPIATVHAWQIGADTSQSQGYEGVETVAMAQGRIISPYWFNAATAFTDTNSVWHLVSLLNYNAGSIQADAEWACRELPRKGARRVLERELVFRTLNDVRSTLANWRREYNCERPDSSLDYRTPEEFRQRAGYAEVESKQRFPHPHGLD